MPLFCIKLFRVFNKMSLSAYVVVAIFILAIVCLIALLVKVVQRCRGRHRHVDLTASLSSAGYAVNSAGYAGEGDNRENSVWNVGVENRDVEKSNGNPCTVQGNELNESKTSKTSHDV